MVSQTPTLTPPAPDPYNDVKILFIPLHTPESPPSHARDMGLLTTWLAEHRESIVFAASMAFLGIAVAFIAVSAVLISLPSDHFTRAGRARERAYSLKHPNLRLLKSIAGYLIFAAGLLMLLLPGPGLLVVLLGLMLADFPGKHTIEHWLLSRRSILSPANRLRRAFHKPPLELA